MSVILAVFQKELIDSLRDRRSLFSLLLFPLLGPILVSVILTQTANQMAGVDGAELPVVGRDNAPALIKFLEDRSIKIVDAPDDVAAAVRDREVPAVLIIPDDFGERFRQAKPATVELIVDESRTDVITVVRRVESLIAAYGNSVGTLRMLAHGSHPQIMRPVTLQKIDLSTPKKRAAIFLNMIPMFVLIASFIGGMHTAMDCTAGERERGSLEPLLITPIDRRALVLGKWLNTVTFSAFNVVFTLGGSLIALSRVPAEDIGVSLSLSSVEVVGVLAAVLPLSIFVSSMQLLVASFARTIKEAQTYLSLLIFAPMLPGMFTMLSPVKTKLWMTAVPMLGQQQLLSDLIRGDAVDPLSFVVAAVSCIALGGLAMAATAFLYQREKIIYGR